MNWRLLTALLCASLAGGCAGAPGQGASDPVLAASYRDYVSVLETHNRHRREREPADAPFGAADLSRNFMTIAFQYETRPVGAGAPLPGTPVTLHRWGSDFSYAIAGSGVTSRDRAEIAALAARIGKLTGLDISPANALDVAEMTILIIGPVERDILRRGIAGSPVGARSGNLLRWSDMDNSPCMGTVGSADGGVIEGALVLIKAETGGSLREACLHEEFAQSLGLFNDAQDVRPSIFNDDQEFALLTAHDELLLRALYDARLSPGMTAREAAPIVTDIMRDLRPPTRDHREESL